MPTGLTLGDRYSNTTILDYNTDPDNDRDDNISDGEHSNDGEELEDDHSLSSFRSVDEGELEDHVKADNVENQGNHHFTHAEIIPAGVSPMIMVTKIPQTMMDRTRTQEWSIKKRAIDQVEIDKNQKGLPNRNILLTDICTSQPFFFPSSHTISKHRCNNVHEILWYEGRTQGFW